jgi:DNA topoisomerase-1
MKDLVHVTGTEPGIRRRRQGTGFSYRFDDGTLVRTPEVLARLRRLAIPPAWTDVWICRDPNGHVQATGRDARGRKQHRYHATWVAARSDEKFAHMMEFASGLPALHRRTHADLDARGLPRRKVLALVAVLLERTLIRVGNDEYARTNGSFGLATMRDGHADVIGMTVRFRFRGKSGKQHDVTMSDRRLARLIQRCQELPGSQLFQYVDEAGVVRDVGSADVNEYLRDAMGQPFTAKDFRTWAGTMLACHALVRLPVPRSAAEGERHVVTAVTAVATLLGNTRAVCRKSYVHPAVIETYLSGTLHSALRTGRPGGRPSTRAVLALLQQHSRRRHREAA